MFKRLDKASQRFAESYEKVWKKIRPKKEGSPKEISNQDVERILLGYQEYTYTTRQDAPRLESLHEAFTHLNAREMECIGLLYFANPTRTERQAAEEMRLSHAGLHKLKVRAFNRISEIIRTSGQAR